MRQPIQPYAVVPCHKCNGSGTYKGEECRECSGYGKLALEPDSLASLGYQALGIGILMIVAFCLSWLGYKFVELASR